jgi:transglutaminase-like putative cysteine protease
VLDWQVQASAPLFSQRDGFGNTIHTCTFSGSTRESLVRAQGVVQTHDVPNIWEYDDATHPLVYLRATPLTAPHARLHEFARSILPDKPQDDDVLRLAQRILELVAYKKNATKVDTTALEAFDLRAGVCQDQAHVMLAACRSAGLPARYVSGYFYAVNEPDLASHAWVDVCMDVAQQRWLSVDITHACRTDERHVRLAVGTDYSSCPPIKGIRHGKGDESMTVDVKIQEVN